WTDQKNIGFRQFNTVAACALTVHVNALVMVVNRYRQFLLGLLLADDVFVEEGLDFMRLRELVRGRSWWRRRPVIFENRVADRNAFVADIRARVVARR